MRGDGDGWSLSPDGSRQWGRHGAAGLLLRAPADGHRSVVLLQHRAPWSHQGGTWALPGGARDSDETTIEAAMREASEEAGIDPALLLVRGERVTASAVGGWTYTTVVADAPRQLATTGNLESAELRWVPEDEVDRLPLHPGFASSWHALRAHVVHLVVDSVVDVVATLPRTVELPDGRFGWLTAPGSVVDAVVTVVVTDDPARHTDSLALAAADLL